MVKAKENYSQINNFFFQGRAAGRLLFFNIIRNSFEFLIILKCFQGLQKRGKVVILKDLRLGHKRTLCSENSSAMGINVRKGFELYFGYARIENAV